MSEPISTKNHQIAGRKTSADWQALKTHLLEGVADSWRDAFADFYETRLRLRYLHPIKLLQDNGTIEGEGFSIAAIQCSLIEFLESTEQGKKYRYVRQGEKLGEHEYKSSRDVFVSFLTQRAPFSSTFDEVSAQDFYIGVRCGLLHEARTKNGWRILAKSQAGMIADVVERIAYRDNFQEALLAYVENYGERLPHEPELQQAFIRKFDDLC